MRRLPIMLKALVLYIFFLISVACMHTFAVGPCEGKHGREPRTLFDYRNHIDLNLYTIVPGQKKIARLGGPRDAELQGRARDEAYDNAFASISRLGLSYEQARPFYLEGYRNLRSRNDQAILRQEIKIYRERETTDWDECQYVYDVELAVPKFPGLGGDLDAAIRQLAQKKVPLTSGPSGKVEINLVDLVQALLTDSNFRVRLEKKLTDERFREDLRFKDDDTQLFLGTVSRKVVEITNYPKGQYRVNSLAVSIIRQAVLPVVQFYLQKYGEVEVECSGYTDQLAISGGIPYSGSADLSIGRITTDFTPPEKEAVETPALIKTNDQLSVARAYEGVAALASLLGRQSGNSALKMRYSGQGMAKAPRGNNPASRKIVFMVSYRLPRG